MDLIKVAIRLSLKETIGALKSSLKYERASWKPWYFHENFIGPYLLDLQIWPSLSGFGLLTHTLVTFRKNLIRILSPKSWHYRKWHHSELKWDLGAWAFFIQSGRFLSFSSLSVCHRPRTSKKYDFAHFSSEIFGLHRCQPKPFKGKDSGSNSRRFKDNFRKKS